MTPSGKPPIGYPPNLILPEAGPGWVADFDPLVLPGRRQEGGGEDPGGGEEEEAWEGGASLKQNLRLLVSHLDARATAVDDANEPHASPMIPPPSSKSHQHMTGKAAGSEGKGQIGILPRSWPLPGP